MADELVLKVVVVDGGTQTSPLDRPSPAGPQAPTSSVEERSEEKSLSIRSAMDSVNDAVSKLRYVSTALVITVQSLGTQLAAITERLAITSRSASPLAISYQPQAAPTAAPAPAARIMERMRARQAPAIEQADYIPPEMLADPNAGKRQHDEAMKQYASAEERRKLLMRTGVVSPAAMYGTIAAQELANVPADFGAVAHAQRQAGKARPTPFNQENARQVEARRRAKMYLKALGFDLEAKTDYSEYPPELEFGHAEPYDKNAAALQFMNELLQPDYAPPGTPPRAQSREGQAEEVKRALNAIPHFADGGEVSDEFIRKQLGIGETAPLEWEKLQSASGTYYADKTGSFTVNKTWGGKFTLYDDEGETYYGKSIQALKKRAQQLANAKVEAYAREQWREQNDHYEDGGLTKVQADQILMPPSEAPTVPPGVYNERFQHWPKSTGMFEEGGEMWPIAYYTDLNKVPKEARHYEDGGFVIDKDGRAWQGNTPLIPLSELGYQLKTLEWERDKDPQGGMRWRADGHAITHTRMYIDRDSAMGYKPYDGDKERAYTLYNAQGDRIHGASVSALKIKAMELAQKHAYAGLADRFDLEDMYHDGEPHLMHGGRIGKGRFYKDGGRVDMSRGGIMPATQYAESGQDWHPAWLTDKEFVINARSTARNKDALALANANPDVKLTPHFASGGKMAAGARVAANALGANAPAALTAAGGPAGMLVGLISDMLLSINKDIGDRLVGVVAAGGGIANFSADPDTNPAKVFASAGSALSAVPLHINPLVRAIGETTKQFGYLMDSIKATTDRYGEYSPTVALAQAQVEIQHTLGDMRRAQEGGTELARYLRAQGDLQQKIEDVKMKLLVQLLPLVTTGVSILEKIMPTGTEIESVAMAVKLLVNPLGALAEVAQRMLGLQEAQNLPQDPTEVLFQNPGVEVPNV